VSAFAVWGLAGQDGPERPRPHSGDADSLEGLLVGFRRFHYGRQWHAIPPPPPFTAGSYPHYGYFTQVTDVVRSAGVLEESLREHRYYAWRAAFDRQTSLYYFYTFGNDDRQCQWQHPGGDEQLMNLHVVLRDPATVSAG
jgi:hypothetical protein